MDKERELALRWKDLRISELIEVLQWQKDLFGDVPVYAKDFEGNQIPVMGADIIFNDGIVKFCP